MKVLTEPPSFEPQKVKCKGTDHSCGAELEIELGDLQRQRHHDADQGKGSRAWDEVFVTCPRCGNRIEVDGVPPYLLARIQYVE